MIKEKIAVIPLSFGVRDNWKDDKVNKELAKLAEKVARQYKLPIIAEDIVALHLKKKPILTTRGNLPGNRPYTDTYSALLQAKKAKITNLVIVAHPEHIGRVFLTAKKMGFNVVGSYSILEIYDKNSTQLWTRNKWFFKIENTLASIWYYFQGKI